MLDKKDVVQKSFRIAKQNDIWLGLLAIKLGRTQNELVNIAIKMLLDDNKKWFFEEFIESTFDLCAITDFQDVKYKKKRLGDIEAEIVPFNDIGRGVYLNITYYDDDLCESVKDIAQIKIDFGPGYGNRIIRSLTDIFENTLNRYPKIMKNFNLGMAIEDY